MKKILKSVISVMMLISTCAYISPVYALSNKETIYSKLDATGKQYKTIVTTKENDEINQEEMKKELPLEAKITYQLDGKDIEAKDLAGKSGKVKIKIEYENKSAKKVTINGKEKTIYTPFMVAVGTIINSKNNKNIKVSECGKIIENGDKTVIVGVVFPGLEESLNLTGKLSKIEIPSSIEITMDSSNFEMSNVLTYATPKVLKDDIDWSEFDNLFDKVNELKNGIQKIEDGSDKLEDGATKLDDGAKQLAEGTKEAYDGSKEIKAQVEKSIKNIKEDKSKALDEKTLKEIGKKASTSALESVKKQLDTIGKSAKSSATKFINDKKAQIGKQASNLATQSLNKQIDTIKSTAKSGAVAEMKQQEEGIFNQVIKMLSSTLNAKVNDLVTGISTGVTSAMNNQLGEIQNASVNAGVKTVDLSKLDKEASIGKINVSIGNDYKSNAKYKNLDDETKAFIDGLVASAEEEAENKANLAAKKSVEDYVSAEKEEIKTIAKKSAQVAAGATSEGLKQGVIKATAEASVKETVNQIAKQVSSEETKQKVNAKLEELAGTVASSTAESVAKQVAPTVASQTAQSTAEQVAGEVADTTAKEVAKQVTETVASQTAISVADTVADEVKSVAMNKVKTSMQTLLDDGMTPLTDGLSKLTDGTNTLKDGTRQLADGTKELKKGIHRFNVEGISKIANFVNVDLKNLVASGKKLEELANEFNQFASDKKREDINFVSLVDGIKSKEDED